MTDKEKRQLKSASARLFEVANALHFGEKLDKKPEVVIREYAELLARMSQ